MPQSNDIWEQLYYNKDMFAKAGIMHPPRTWGELLADGKKLTHPPAQYGLALLGHQGEDTICTIDSFIYSSGGRVLNADGTKAVINSPAAVQAIKFYQSLAAIAPAGTINRMETDAASLFTARKVAMTLDGSWQQDSYTLQGGKKLHWGVAVPPAPTQAVSPEAAYLVTNILSDNHARDAYSDVELALDERGKFLALRIRHLGNMGAYIGAVGANIQTVNMARCLPGMYDIPRIDIGVRCVFTNTTTTAPYRGAGRPEANYMLERAVEEAARVSGIDPIRLRRRNLTKPSAMPYKTAVGTTIDSGEFETVLDKALALISYDGFKQRKREAANDKV